MGKNYEKQILDHSIEKFSLIIKDNIDMFSSTKALTEVNKNVVLQINSINSAKKIIKDLKWHIKKDKYIKLQHS